MSTWKKYGGIYKLENNNNITAHILTTDSLTIRGSYYGLFDIEGQLHVNGDILTDSNLKGNNLTILNDISTNRLFVKDKTFHYNDVDISANLIVHSGNVHVLTDVNVGGVIRLENQLYLGNSGKSYLFGTDVNGNIGVNTTTPIAAYDISSSYPIAFNVGSATQEQLFSIPVQNKNNRGIVLAANTNVSKISFFNDTSINANTNTITDGTITYSRGGIMTFDVSDNTNILSKLSVSYRPNNVTSHVMGETAVIYDISAGQYLKPIYENETETTGSALSLIANDASSITFMNIITPNKQGLSIGGGVYPNDQTRSMGSIGWRDTSANYTPSINIVSGKSNIRNKTTVGINTQSPSTESYAVDMNGQVHLKNGELTITAQPTMEIRALGVGKTAPKSAVAVGSSYKKIPNGSSSDSYIYKQQILYTNDGGENWKYNYDLSGDSIEIFNNSNTNLNAVYVYDSSLTIIGGNNAYAFYTYGGYEQIYFANKTWQTIINPFSQNNPINYSIKSIYVNSVKRVFFGIDVSGANSFVYSFNMLDSSGGFNSKDAIDSSINTTNIGIKSMDGYGNVLWVIVGTTIRSISIDNPTVMSFNGDTKSGNYNSISVLDESNLIAAGNNIISFSTDGGSNWTDISENIPIVNSIRIIDSSNAIAVCNTGIVLKSLNWSNAESWSKISNDELNVSGNANRLCDTSYNLTNVGVVDINNFYITKTIQQYGTLTFGNTSLFHTYIPNVFNNVNNFVFDVSGSVRISGDMNVNDGGKIASNNQTFNLLNSGVNQINFGGDASNVYIGSLRGSTVVVNSNLNVLYDSLLNGNIKVKQNGYINANLGVTGNINLNSNLNVTGNINLNSNLNVTGNINLNSNLNVTGNINLNSDLNVTGNINLKSNLNVSGNINFESELNITGNTNLQSNLNVTRNINLQSDLNVTGNINLNSNLNVTGNINLNSNLNVTGNINLNSNLNVTGNINLNSNLNVTGNINLNSNLNVTGNINLNSNLYVTGNSFLNSNVVIGLGQIAPGCILTVYGSIQAISYNSTSDRRLKSNIKMLSNQSKAILAIEPVTFDWKVNGKHDIGFIAQNVYKTYPELIPNHLADLSLNLEEPADASGNPIYYAMDYSKMTPFLWQGMREIIQRLDVLESENRNLKIRIEQLESK